MGQLDHPNSLSTKLDKATHVLDSVSYDPKTKIASAKSYILDTSGGNNFLVLLKSGLKLGASMRGSGTVTNGRVERDYSLGTIDFVESPSFGNDTQIDVSNLIESANDLLGKKEEKKMKELPELPYVTPAQVWAEAKCAGIDPAEYAKRINDGRKSLRSYYAHLLHN